MRVISGRARGLRLISLEGLLTRPTTDRVKESIFNILQPFIPCKRVLDLFSGSGAIGIEALSRGCDECVFVEKSHDAFSIINKNLEKSGLMPSSKRVLGDALVYLDGENEPFDLIFLDPPYNSGLLSPVFDKIVKNNLLTENGIVLLESEFGGETVEDDRFICFKSAKYGKTIISVFRRS